MEPYVIVLIIVVIILMVLYLIIILSRYRKCPSDKIMVIYGKVGLNKDGSVRFAKCIHGGAAFIVPLFQAYKFLDLTPISIDIDLKYALTRQKEKIKILARFTVAISTEAGVMQNAAERLLGLKQNEIQTLAQDIIFGQLRLVIATMSAEEISETDKFLEAVCLNVETEIKKIGLRLINVNISDITDEYGAVI